MKQENINMKSLLLIKAILLGIILAVSNQSCTDLDEESLY